MPHFRIVVSRESARIQLCRTIEPQLLEPHKDSDKLLLGTIMPTGKLRRRQ
jgi:hypothetical protein